MSPALYLIDTSGLFRILQDKVRQAWTDQLTPGVIAVRPVVELCLPSSQSSCWTASARSYEFLYSARSLADRLATELAGRDERIFGLATGYGLSHQALTADRIVAGVLAELG